MRNNLAKYFSQFAAWFIKCRFGITLSSLADKKISYKKDKSHIFTMEHLQSLQFEYCPEKQQFVKQGVIKCLY